MRYITLVNRLALAAEIRGIWLRHAQTLLRVTIVLLTIAATLKLGEELRRLIWAFDGGDIWNAWDLKNLHDKVGLWFSGASLYTLDPSEYSPYPPASWVLFYPVLGWLPLGATRWLWIAVTAAALTWLVYLLARLSGAKTRVELALVSLFLLAMNATGVAFGVGQWILILTPFLIVGIFALRQSPSWQRDLIAALCLIVTLIKPNISVPFLWIVLFSSGGWRVFGLTGLGYGVLTLFASLFQPTPLLDLTRQWLGQVASLSATQGYGNVSIWASNLGYSELGLFASILVFIVTGIWAYRHRRADLWLVLGVVAISARMWTYHNAYDNVVILFPMVALFRIAKRGESADGYDVMAGILLAATMAMMLLPGQISSYPWPSNFPYWVGHPLIWAVVLVFLVKFINRETARSSDLIKNPSSARVAL